MNLLQFRITDELEAKELFKSSDTKTKAQLIVGGVAVMVCLSSISMVPFRPINDAEYQPKVVFMQQILQQQDVLLLEDIRLHWQKDMEYMRFLQDNWDNEGAQVPNAIALDNMEDFISSLDSEIARRISLYPNSFGAVTLKLETPKGRIKCEIGDELMSYFVKRPDFPNEYHSFEQIDQVHLNELRQNLATLV